MKALCGLYPSLGRHFKSMTELAHAANRSRDYVWRCLNGQRDFTRADKKAISANIVASLLRSNKYEYSDLENAMKAYEGDFDEIYKVKADDRRTVHQDE